MTASAAEGVQTPQAMIEVSVRVIEAAVGLAVRGLLTATDVIRIGCMTPECLTLATLEKVAEAAGIEARELMGF